PLQICKIVLHRWIGMMVGEIPVDLGVEQVMLARQPRDERFQRRASRAVAGIPSDPQLLQPAFAYAGQPRQQALDIPALYLALFHRADTIDPGACSRDLAQLQDVPAEEGAALK